jgi:hypothetical protein
MFHVITPLVRFENMKTLIEMLRPQQVQWNVITDEDNPTHFPWKEDWISHFICPNRSIEFWARCNYSINWFLENNQLEKEDYYCILNDDDGYEENFFHKLRVKVGSNNTPDLMITSMKRGYQVPPYLPLVKQHPTTTLMATPENMRVCSVGVEQFFIKGKHFQNHRLPLTPYGDGELIVELVQTYNTLYLPQLFVLFNYLEPGRWVTPNKNTKHPPVSIKKMPLRLQKYIKFT